jgi:ribonuclease HII
MNSDQTKKVVQKTPEEMLTYERDLWSGGMKHVAGIDEAGRGPLAGPVVAAAVVFPAGTFIPSVDDSKVLTSIQREELYWRISSEALAVGVGIVDHAIIDEINILNATFRAMHEAISQLPFVPDYLLIDGNRFAPEDLPPGAVGIPFTTIIDGDARCFSIAAASIIAKVTRDRIMLDYDRQFPGYGFAHNKGYATQEHRDAIASLGYCPIHRRTFHLKSQLELEF